MARTLFICGGIMVAVLLGMLFWWTITAGGLTVRQLTLFFSTFVFLQFWNMFNAKGFETRHSVFTCLRGCREFFLILLAIAAGQVLIVEFGGEVFRTEPLAWREWAAVIGCTSLLATAAKRFVPCGENVERLALDEEIFFALSVGGVPDFRSCLGAD